MDVRVAISLVLVFVSLVGGQADILSQEPVQELVENRGLGRFWRLIHQFFNLDKQIKDMKDDIEELKSKVENGPASQLPSTERVYICEYNGNSGKGSISCAGKPGTYLDIEFAHYGRTARGICVHPTISSTFTGCTKGVGSSWATVRRLCQKKVSCELQAQNNVFGDPCYGTAKYLEVQYTCKPSG